MKRLFIYLFGISLLFTIYTYSYYSKKVAFEAERYTKMKTKLTDSIQSLLEINRSNQYFNLAYNDAAQDYFIDNPNLSISSISEFSSQIKEALIAFNDLESGNPYTGQEQINEQKFIIERVRVLNHRWIIADFTDGKFWGEALIKYFAEDDGSFTFEHMHAILYF
jgi:hypothetical protein